jgi:hypothetical protein
MFEDKAEDLVGVLRILARMNLKNNHTNVKKYNFLDKNLDAYNNLL